MKFSRKENPVPRISGTPSSYYRRGLTKDMFERAVPESYNGKRKIRGGKLNGECEQGMNAFKRGYRKIEELEILDDKN